MKSTWLYLSFLMLSVALIFLPLTGEKVLAPLDLFKFYGPWYTNTQETDVHNHFACDFTEVFLAERLFAHTSYRREGRVGWSDLSFSGTAQYANTMNLYFDWTMQLNRFLPFWTAWHIGLFGQLLLAAIGMFVFLRSRSISNGPACLGATCYGFNSFFFTWMFHGWMLSAFCWLPWVLWTMYSLREGKRRGGLTPLFLLPGFLGGHLQFAAYYVIVVAAYILLWFWEDRKLTIGRRLQNSLPFAVCGILAAGMAAFMFLPTINTYRLTLQAGLVRGGLGYPQGWTQPLRTILLYPFYIFPYILGRPQTLDFAKLFPSDLMLVPFIGSFSLLAGVIHTTRSLRSKSGINGPVLMMALGLLLPLTPLVGPLYLRLHILFILGASWAAAHALDSKHFGDDRRLASLGMKLFVGASIIWIAASALIMRFRPQILALLANRSADRIAAHRFGLFTDWWSERIARTVSNLQIWTPEMLVPWILLGIALVAYRQRAVGRATGKIFVWVIILTTLGQLLWYNKNWLSYADKPGHDVPEFAGRDMLERHLQPWHRVATVQQEERPVLFPLNTLSLFNLAHYHGYGSIYPPGIQLNLQRYTVAGDLNPREFGRWGVTHAIAYHDENDLDPDWHLIETAGVISLYSNTLACARYEAMLADGTGTGLKPILHQFNHRQLMLPEHAISMQVIENWGEGWQYRINQGAWQDMNDSDAFTLYADFKVPTASGNVFEMRYRPRLFRIGRWIALASFALYAMFTVNMPRWVHPFRSDDRTATTDWIRDVQ